MARSIDYATVLVRTVETGGPPTVFLVLATGVIEAPAGVDIYTEIEEFD